MGKNENHDVEELIPWFVNGSLDEVETNRVNNAISESPDISELIEKELGLAEINNRDSKEIEILLGKQSESLSMLKNKINSEAKPITTKKVALTFRKMHYLYAMAASIFVTAITIGLFPLFKSNVTEGEYQTLSNIAPNQQGVVLQIIFEPETTEKEIRLLLLESEGQLLSGPSRSGVYRLALRKDIPEITALNRFRGQSIVRWVEIEAP